jgi:hypothetical protein
MLPAIAASADPIEIPGPVYIHFSLLLCVFTTTCHRRRTTHRFIAHPPVKQELHDEPELAHTQRQATSLMIPSYPAI